MADHRPAPAAHRPTRVWWSGDRPTGAGPCVVTVGAFDGVHRGHQAVVGEAARRASQLGLDLVAVTFDPHPADVVRPGPPPPRLCTLHRRVQLLGAAGADAVWVLGFTAELSQLTPEQFVGQVLVPALAPVSVVVGADFRFGHRAAGDATTLVGLGDRHGFEVIPVPLLGRDGPRPWSSTTVRSLLADGDVAGAGAVLGRPHRLEGTVVHGDHRGRALGYPTANIDVTGGLAVPADGVYAAVLGRSDGTAWPAAVSVGTNPTFDGDDRRVEAYIVDAPDPSGPDALDLYGEHVTLDLVERLRPMLRFDSVDDLVTQMGRDVSAARHALH